MRLGLIAPLFPLLVCVVVQAEDSPPAAVNTTAPTTRAISAPTSTSWASFRKNLAQTGVAESSLPESLELLWQISAGDQIVAAASIVGDEVYIPCLSGELLCVDRATGQKHWGYQSVEVVEPNSFAPGFKASPTVTADMVYLGDEDGVFHAIERATGKLRWKFATGGEIYSSAAVDDGRIVFGSYDNSLYCLKEADGSLLWKEATEGYVHCAPAVAEGKTFVAGCDEQLHVIDLATGKADLEKPLSTYLIASPAVVGSTLYVGTYASEVVAFDWKRGEVQWRYEGSRGDFPFHSSAAVTDELVVVGGRDKLLHGIERATGKGRWKFETRGRIDSSPAIVGNRVFVGSNDGNLYEVDLQSGEERWKFRAGKPITAGIAIGEGVLVVGSESRDGQVYCFGQK